MASAEIRPFRIDIPDADLDDLRQRLARVRWPAEVPHGSAEYGVPIEHVRAYAQHWAHDYDWRAHEAELNRWPQLKTSIDGDEIHFIHARSTHAEALPLVVMLGFPSSPAELLPILFRLVEPTRSGGDERDAFHVVAPSFPGFGFSGAPASGKWSVRRIADAMNQLMQRLGYSRYGVQGGDWGAVVAPEMARAAPARVQGVHVNALVLLPPDDPHAFKLSEREQRRINDQKEYMRQRLGYAQLQSTRPQTLAFSLADSPVGQLAWNLDLYDAFSRRMPQQTPIDRDAILTSVSISWFTNTAGSSARIYRDAGPDAFRPRENSGVPTGVAVFAGDSAIRRFAESSNTIVHWSEFDTGGHFASMQAPELLVGDIRAFFRKRQETA
jgi:pimeloyl-ACP methyl ester carboxylesterase